MRRWNRLDSDVTFESFIRPLIDRGILEPLADHDGDRQLWMDCDLCSYIENRFHQRLEPEAITPEQRIAWSRRTLASDEQLWDPRESDFIAAFWIIDRGARVGTIALAKMLHSYPFVPVFSLYLLPTHRARGLAYRTLRAVHQTTVAAGHAGIRISTFWTWQTALQRYLFRYGMWAWSFKRSIDFVWTHRFPRYTVTVDEAMARFAIDRDGRSVELLTASRDGDLLIWNELSAMSSGELDTDIVFHARSTLAVALAIHGWPLLRAGEDLHHVAGHDVGGPKVLARKIAIFEFFDRESGFDVRTPHIPGLPHDVIAREIRKERGR